MAETHTKEESKHACISTNEASNQSVRQVYLFTSLSVLFRAGKEPSRATRLHGCASHKWEMQNRTPSDQVISRCGATRSKTSLLSHDPVVAQKRLNPTISVSSFPLHAPRSTLLHLLMLLLTRRTIPFASLLLSTARFTCSATQRHNTDSVVVHKHAQLFEKAFSSFVAVSASNSRAFSYPAKMAWRCSGRCLSHCRSENYGWIADGEKKIMPYNKSCIKVTPMTN